MSDVSGLSLDGSFNMTITDLSNYDFTDNSAALYAYQVTTFRDVSAAELTASYYIKVQYDINSHISFTNDSSDNSSLDDAWDLSAIDISNGSSSIGDVTYNLPEISNNVFMGVIIPTSGDDDIGITSTVNSSTGGVVPQHFYVESDVTVDSEGNVSASDHKITSRLTDYNGTEGHVFYMGTFVDQYGVAQRVYWDLSGADTSAPDISADDITNQDINLLDVNGDNGALKQETITAVESFVSAFRSNYQDSLVESWSISVNAVPKNNQNIISLFARNKPDLSNANTDSDTDMTNVFATGEKIVVNTPQTYSVNLTDYNGNERKLLGSDRSTSSFNVYGVLEQQSS